MLFKPWKEEKAELIDVDAEQVFLLNSNAIMKAKKEFRTISDETLDGYLAVLEDENEEDEDEDNEQPSHRVLYSENENDFSRYTLDIDDSEEGNYHREADAENDLNLGTGSTSNRTYCEKLTVPERLSNQDFKNLLTKLNLNQRDYLCHTIHHVRTNKDRTVRQMFNIASSNTTWKSFGPFYHFVTGGAGVGKSMLIKTLFEALSREFDSNTERDTLSPSVLLTAPTGKAAFVIGGQTVHQAFHLPVNQNHGNQGLPELSSDVSHSMSVGLKDLKVVIIDEISMISDKMLSYVDQRLKHIFDRDLPFGGVSVICVGDFLQLLAVQAKNVYSSNAKSKDLWHLFQTFRLTEIMRQRDDQSFAIALNNMAAGSMTSDDICLIRNCVLRLTTEELQAFNAHASRNRNDTNSSNDNIDLPSLPLPHLDRTRTTGAQNTTSFSVSASTNSNMRGICLFKTNEEVHKANNSILMSMNTEGAVSVAFDRVTGMMSSQSAVDHLIQSADSENFGNLKNGGLIKKLLLKIGARYMMTKNIDTSDGLVNGATGYLMKIDYGRRSTVGTNAESSNQQDSGPAKPMRLWVKFEENRAGLKLRRRQERIRGLTSTSDDTWTMIEPTVGTISKKKDGSLSLQRKQFPVVPAEAMTVHKSQGGTYDSVVVYDIGKRRMARSALYVACSRATTAAGLKIITKDNKFIAPTPIWAEEQSDLVEELRRQHSVQLVPSFKHLSTRSPNNDDIQVISYNVEVLGPNFRQITSDSVFLSSDVLLLNETWTESTNEFVLPGFQMLSTVDRELGSNQEIGSRCYISDRLLQRSSLAPQAYSGVFQSGTRTISVAAVKVQDTLYCSIYVSPRPILSLLLEALHFIIEKDYRYVVIAGDFNIDFNVESSLRSSILSFMNDNGLSSAIPSSVTSTTRLKTKIDNIFVNCEAKSAGTYVSFTSYHEPLWLVI